MAEPRHLAPVTFYNGGDPGKPVTPMIMQKPTPADIYAAGQVAADLEWLLCEHCGKETDDPQEAPALEGGQTVGPWCPDCIANYSLSSASPPPPPPKTTKGRTKAPAAELPPD